MQKATIKDVIYAVLKKDPRIWNEEKTELNQILLFELIDNTDETLIDLLLQNKQTRDVFFVKIRDVYIFKTNDFRFFMDENKVDNSYTRYKNRIGLTDGKKFLKDSGDVVLNRPFKDCVLEGGQSSEEGMDTYFEYSDKKGEYTEEQAKRKEIFFNQILAKDEIDRLYDPKALVNWKRFTKDGEKEVKEIKRDEAGIIKENLIMKGNNLIALHSLRSEFTGRVKLIYIDPPYNTGSDGFKYNDNFNHSTWLTFMKNRLEIAKELLQDDGVIFVQCDHHEMGYLNILLDEVFGITNKIQQIAVKVASASGFKAVNPGPVDVLENILFYAKNKSQLIFKKNYIETAYNQNYNLYFDRTKENILDWKLIPIKEKVLNHYNYKDEKEAKAILGKFYKHAYKQMLEDFAFDFADNIVSIRDLHKPTQQMKDLQDLSKKERDKFFVYKKQDGDETFIINGGAIAFYSTKIREIDGEKKVTELLTNFWDHISWAGIASEGGVKLKNGKKPEKLLKQILDISTSYGDLVLDYHLGSGTTCAVAHKMGRQYIGIEQMNYDENDSIVRLQNVIKGDASGISKSVNWNGGGDFVYCELAKRNEEAKEIIQETKDIKTLESFFDTLYNRYFLNYNLKIKEFKEKIIKEKEFKDLSLDDQKKMFLTMLDLNQMYIPKTEMEDKRFGISKKDQGITKNFYNAK
ncbi:site-specific DNA-methyltransferase [Candidatus Gracilibacteria bacterium]|nr:site-specific DNA-methyltransferase [Candidatus Gracilibacteria bacterium]